MKEEPFVLPREYYINNLLMIINNLQYLGEHYQENVRDEDFHIEILGMMAGAVAVLDHTKLYLESHKSD